MPLTVDQALLAGALAGKIKGVQELLAVAQTARANDWVISRLCATDPVGCEHPLLTANLDLQTSQAALDYTIGVYQAMIADLEAQLSALTT